MDYQEDHNFEYIRDFDSFKIVNIWFTHIERFLIAINGKKSFL